MKDWETIRRWEDAADGFLQMQCDESVEAGYFYRVLIQVRLYDSDGQMVETTELVSAEIAY